MKDASDVPYGTIAGKTFTVGLSTHDSEGNELFRVEVKIGEEVFECPAEAALKLAELIVTMAKRAIAAR